MRRNHHNLRLVYLADLVCLVIWLNDINQMNQINKTG